MNNEVEKAVPTQEIALGRSRDGLIVDKHNLDLELCQQSVKFDQAGQEYAKALAKKDNAKFALNSLDNQIKTLYASTSIRIRNQLKATGEKSTEEMIRCMIITDPEIIKLEEQRLLAELEYIDTTYWANRWESVKDAYNGRGPNLREVGALLMAGYYQVDSVKRN
jgi:small-conductance mechanosensitive channel